MGLKNKSFLLRYKWWIVALTVILIIGYVVIYLCFKGEGFIYVGDDLEKKDWLSFLGAYLSFAGTVIVSLIALFQSRFFVENDKAKLLYDRKKELQPIFSVTIENINSQIPGTAEVFSLYDKSTNPKHKNVVISVENVNKYPVRNVIIFDKYLWQLLKSNDKQTIYVAYSDSPDIKSWKEKLIEINKSEYECTQEGIPKWFNIVYDDIDGNEMFQTFELKEYDGEKYYSLQSIEQTNSNETT